MKERVFDLEERLIAFAVRVIRAAESLPKTPTGNHIRSQLLRSGTSPAPKYSLFSLPPAGNAMRSAAGGDFAVRLNCHSAYEALRGVTRRA